MTVRLQKFFGKDFTKELRIKSYDFIETYISDTIKQWDTAPDTDKIAADFSSVLTKLDKSDFVFFTLPYWLYTGIL